MRHAVKMIVCSYVSTSKCLWTIAFQEKFLASPLMATR